MFVVRKGDEKKNRFITHYEPPSLSEIKIDNIKPQKIPLPPKIEKKEQINVIETKNIIIPPQIPKNLFCILHNQNQTPVIPPKFNTPHLKKKRIIDDDTGNTIGRWSRDEHKKFIEAIIKFGNNWKEVQEYVNTRTSTQARSHAQKFFEKIKKNNTLKFFDSLDSDYSENFTNATILQLHNSYGNKSKSEINSIVNKFLSLEYDLPKKRRKIMNSNMNGISRKKNIENNYKKNSNNNEDYNENEIYEEQEENEDNKDGNYNYDENNEYNSNNNYDDNIKDIIRNNILIEDGNINNIHEYYSNNIRPYNDQLLQKPKFAEEVNNIYYDNQENIGYNYNYTANGIDYIINQFVNNLSGNIYDINSCDSRLKKNKRKGTFESIEEGSYLGHDNNMGLLNNQNNNTKSRKNSLDSINKLIQNDKKDFNDFYKKVFVSEELNQNKPPFEMNDFRNQNLLEDDLAINLLNKK